MCSACWCRLKFPPSCEAITAALIVCDTSFWSSYQHPKLATSLPVHSIHKLKLWQDETNMQCHESSKLLVSTCLSNLSVSSIDCIYIQNSSESSMMNVQGHFLSDEADSSSPLQSINWKLKSRKVEQCLKLTQSHWWVELRVPRQSYIFMWSSILVEESVLNIAIHKKHSLRQKALRKVSGDELLCEARIQFDDLWKHRAPETQEIKCEPILSWPLPI